jgi:predicted permease
MVAVIGSLAGLAVVVILQNVVGGMILANTVEIPEIPIDWRLVAMTVAIAFGVSIVMGIAPARLSARKDLALAISSGGRFAGRTRTRLRTAFAVVQIALSLTLLVGALLFTATLQNLRRLDPGFQSKGVTAYDLEFRTQGYRPERISAFYRELLARVSSMPGITAAAVAVGAPMFGGEIGMVRSFRPEDAASWQRYLFSRVSADYFTVMGIGLVSGRSFTPEETREQAPETSIVISESLARRVYGTSPAVGQVLTIPQSFGEPRHDVRIIGVAEDVRWDDLTGSPPLMLYRPLNTMTELESLFVRSLDRTDLTIAMVRDAVKAIDPALPMRARVMEELVSLMLTQQRTFAWVLRLLASIGFLLAALGIHGLVSQAVVERNREFGIRLAVGAKRHEIVGLVLRSTLTMVAAGTMLGSLLAAVLAFALRSRLFGITPGHPVPYIAALAALFLVVLMASLAPAWSASRSDPSDVLRSE